jgi:hypothetical protein
MVLAAAALAALALSACDKAAPAPAAGASATPSSAPSSAPASSPAATTGTATADDWCAMVIADNTKWGTMVNKVYLPPNKWTDEQRKGVATDALNNKDKYLAATPPEIKDAVQLELTYYAALRDNNWDVAHTPPPAGFLDAVHKLATYQHDKCGITIGT